MPASHTSISHLSFILLVYACSGRTARAGAKGVTIAFVSQSDSTAFAATLKTVNLRDCVCVHLFVCW